MYGRQTECAIAAMSRLAEAYDGGRTRLSAAEIADSRHQRRPFVAKILSALSQAQLVTGTRGPGGGFTLARDPADISLYEVYRLFDRDVEHKTCPFSGGQCGIGPPCALHERLSRVREGLDTLLRDTTFDVFREAAPPAGKTKSKKTKSKKTKKTAKRDRRPGG